MMLIVGAEPRIGQPTGDGESFMGLCVVFTKAVLLAETELNEDDDVWIYRPGPICLRTQFQQIAPLRRH